MDVKQLNQISDFQNVEMTELDTSTYHYYIENSKSIKSTLFFLVSFIVIHIIAAWNAPPLLVYEEVYYPINKTVGMATVDLDVALSSLSFYHKYVNINGSLVRDLDKSLGYLSIPSTITISTYFEKDGQTAQTMVGKPYQSELVFDGVDTQTQSFPILSNNISNADTIKLRISIELNVTFIEGISISWSYSNLSAAKYSRAARIIASFLTGYMLIIFVTFMNFSTTKFIQILVIIVGVTGFLSSNPFALILPFSPGVVIADHILNGFFLAAYRLLLLSQLEVIRRQSASPMPFAAVFLILFCIVYAVISSYAGFERANLINESVVPNSEILQSEKVLMYYDIAYVIVSFIWIIAAFVQGSNYAPVRLAFVLFLSILSLSSTVASDIILPKLNYMMFSILPSMIVTAAHLNSAAFCIFMFHNGGDSYYAEMNTNKQAGGSLDVEELSDSDDQLLQDEDEEEEEEEE